LLNKNYQAKITNVYLFQIAIDICDWPNRKLCSLQMEKAGILPISWAAALQMDKDRFRRSIQGGSRI